MKEERLPAAGGGDRTQGGIKGRDPGATYCSRIRAVPSRAGNDCRSWAALAGIVRTSSPVVKVVRGQQAGMVT